MDFSLQGIAEFLHLNARNGFSLFAASVSTLLLLRYEVFKDDLTEIPIAYLACLGLSVGLWICIEKLGAKVGRVARRHLRDAKARQVAVANLRLLQRHEFEALAWIHHHKLSRIRADQMDDPIDALTNMGLLQVEDHQFSLHDRIFIVPDFVREWLAERIGAPDASSVGNTPPWLERHGRL